MTRILTAEGTLQGQTLSSRGALACLSGLFFDHEDKPVRRELADTGRPVARWSL
jgi:hypothetical protein